MGADRSLPGARPEALRAEIKAGLDSGPTGPLDMAEIKAEARAKRRAARDAR